MKWPNKEKLMENFSKSKNTTIAFPESGDQRIFQAACYLAANSTAKKVMLFLHEKDFDRQFDLWGVGYKKNAVKERIMLVPKLFASLADETRDFLEAKAKNKGRILKEHTLEQQGNSSLYQAGFLLEKGEVDSVLAGAVSTTSAVIKAGLQTVGLAEGIKTLSGSFLLLNDNAKLSSMIFADCGVVINPNVEQLVDIASESVRTWEHIYGKESKPYVAFLSFSSKGSASHPAAEKMAKAFSLFQQKHPEISSDGELQFDAAVDAELGRRKAPGSEVCGKANIFIFPDLNAGNIAYKISQRLAAYRAYGPILQGLAKPYSDLSRGASVKDIIISTYINAIRSK